MAALVLEPALADTRASWRSDVRYLVSQVEAIHPDPFRANGRDVWLQQARRLEETIDTLEPHRAILGLQRLLALAADGHTEPVDRVHPALRGRWLPLLLRRFDDGWFVRTGHRDYTSLFGKRITKLGGVPIEEVVARVRPFVSADNEWGALDPIGNHLRYPAVLHAAGVIPSVTGEIAFAAVDAEGRESTIVVWASEDVWVTDEWLDSDKVLERSVEPLYRRIEDNYEFHYLQDDRIAYVGFTSIRDDGPESIEQFFGRVFDFVEAHEVDKFVLDIRENSGGNLELNLPVLHGILRSKINRPGSLFVIIGRDTYSAAMNLAVLLERHTYALFVGEPTGATPNHFGDTVEVTLPASGLVVEISELYWQNSDPRDRRPWIAPDLPAPLRSTDFFTHRDPALETIRRFEATPEMVDGFGPPVRRWRRPNQVHPSPQDRTP